MTDQLLYIDPGSGSYLVQVIVAGALGVVFFFRNIVTYIRAFFGLSKKKKESNENSVEENETKKS
jgi:hypothetical protein